MLVRFEGCRGLDRVAEALGGALGERPDLLPVDVVRRPERASWPSRCAEDGHGGVVRRGRRPFKVCPWQLRFPPR
jgi:hypothetical protein